MATFKDIVKEWDGEPVDSIVCIPLSRQSVPTVDSSIEHCHQCQQEVWLAPTSLVVIEKYPTTPLTCLDCLMTKVKEKG